MRRLRLRRLRVVELTLLNSIRFWLTSRLRPRRFLRCRLRLITRAKGENTMARPYRNNTDDPGTDQPLTNPSGRNLPEPNQPGYPGTVTPLGTDLTNNQRGGPTDVPRTNPRGSNEAPRTNQPAPQRPVK